MHQLQAVDYIKENENIRLERYLVRAGRKAERHTHDFFEIEYICSGSGFQTINDKTYFVERGDLIFINIGDIHAYNTEYEMGIINCLLTPEFFNNELISLENAMDMLALSCFRNYYSLIDNIPPKTRFTGKELLGIETVIELMIEEFTEKSEDYIGTLKNYMNIFLTKIFRAMKKSDHDYVRDISKVAPQILSYIEENYRENLSLKELAQNCFYTPNYFSRIFKECFGKSFIEYVNGVRVGKAIDLLKKTDYNIDDICCHVGYKDKKQFYKLFKLHTGLTPKQYKDNRRKVTDKS